MSTRVDSLDELLSKVGTARKNGTPVVPCDKALDRTVGFKIGDEEFAVSLTTIKATLDAVSAETLGMLDISSLADLKLALMSPSGRSRLAGVQHLP